MICYILRWGDEIIVHLGGELLDLYHNSGAIELRI